MKAAPRPRRGRPRVPQLAHQRRAQIIAAAIPHFARDGYAGADVQALADEVGIAKGTIYRYFANKQDLFHATVDHVMRQLLAAIENAQSVIADPLEQVEAAIETYLAFFDAHPEYVELLIQERAGFRDRKGSTYFRYRDASVQRWTRIYAALIDDGRIRAVPPEQISEVMGAVVYGAMFTNHLAGRKQTPRQQACVILNVVFNGILSAGEQEARRRRAARQEHSRERANRELPHR